MRHTVIGLFDTYTQAEAARDTLVQTGFARTDIELQANPVTPSGADIDPAAHPEAGHGFMANLERFLASLFASGPRPADPATTARYADAVRRGAVLVCVSAASESHAELAGRTLAKLGAIDIGERAPAWDSPMMDTTAARDQSMLDELGIGAAGAMPPPLDDDATRAVSSAAAPGSGAYMAPAAPAAGAGTGTGTGTGAGAGAGAGDIGAPVPDEFLEYEEDFRGHYDEAYADEGARYEDYSGAYHYGAKMGQDVRYRDRQWDEIEPEARRNWETTPQGDTWERFKAAVRHGWDRVTGHHHV